MRGPGALVAFSGGRAPGRPALRWGRLSLGCGWWVGCLRCARRDHERSVSDFIGGYFAFGVVRRRCSRGHRSSLALLPAGHAVGWEEKPHQECVDKHPPPAHRIRHPRTCHRTRAAAPAHSASAPALRSRAQPHPPCVRARSRTRPAFARAAAPALRSRANPQLRSRAPASAPPPVVYVRPAVCGGLLALPFASAELRIVACSPAGTAARVIAAVIGPLTWARDCCTRRVQRTRFSVCVLCTYRGGRLDGPAACRRPGQTGSRSSAGAPPRSAHSFRLRWLPAVSPLCRLTTAL